MAFEITMLFVGAAMVSAALGYACWVKVRVIRLREDIFAIRNRLFDKMTDLSSHDDPAYRHIRDELNTALQIADLISIPLLAYFWHMYRHDPQPEQRRSDREQVQRGVDAARVRLRRRLASYLSRETLTGLMSQAIVAAIPAKAIRKEVQQGVDTCLAWDAPERLRPLVK